jgi:hypothetical protein
MVWNEMAWLAIQLLCRSLPAQSGCVLHSLRLIAFMPYGSVSPTISVLYASKKLVFNNNNNNNNALWILRLLLLLLMVFH